MRYNTQGIILRKQNFRGSDSFFSIYTKDTGKVEAIARGVRKSKSKLGGHLDYFLVADIMIAEGKKFNHIAGALIDLNFYNIKERLSKVNLGFYCLEITDYFIKSGKKDERIFYLLKDFLKTLNCTKGLNKYIYSVSVSYFYILKLLDYLGYKPELFACVHCRSDIKNNEYYFNPLSGGVICPGCIGVDDIKIPYNVINLLRSIISSPLINIRTDEIDKKLLKESVGIIDSFLLFRLDKDIKSRKFLTN